MAGINKSADSKTKTGKSLPAIKVTNKNKKGITKKIIQVRRNFKSPVSKEITEILNHIPFGISLLDAKTGSYVFANDACLKILNTGKDELLGSSPGEAKDRRTSGRNFLNGSKRTEKKKIEIKKISVAGNAKKAKYILLVMRDVTEISKIQKNLKERKDDYQTLFQSSPAISFIIDKSGKVKEVNRAFYNASSLTGKDVIEKHLNRLGFSLSPVYIGEIKKLLEEQGYVENKYAEISFNGKKFFGYISVFPVNYKKNDCYVTVFNDMTDLLKAEKNLKENKSRLEKIFNITPDLVHIYDLANSKTVFINKNFEAVLGYKTGDIIKFGSALITKLIHPDDRKIYLEKIKSQLPDLKDNDFIEDYIRLKNKFGEYLWFQAYECVYDRDSNGNPASILSLMTNITNLKNAERKLKKINKQLQTAQDIAKLGYWEYDMINEKAEWSSEIYKLFDLEPYSIELTKEKLLGLLDSESLKTINRFLNELKQKFDVSFIIKVNTLEARIKYIQVFMHKSLDTDGNIKKLSGTMQDITQRIIYEDKIRNYALLLEKENQSKNKYMSILAHDLKSPFAGMLGYSELLSEDFRYLSREDIYTYVKEMNASLKGVYNLIDTLLEWTRLHTGKVQYTPEKMNLLEIITEIGLELKNIYKDKKINYSVDVSEAVEVSADAHMLRAVFTNLISNSFKYTEAGGSIIISAEVKDNLAEISISDTGVGIPPENIKKLYRIEENFSTPGTSNEKGTGLGLILCKEYLDLHNSELKVKSETGIGTTFSFTLKKS